MYPGMGLCVPATGEYIVAEPWRRREDIATIIELTSRKGRAALVRRLIDDLKGTGHRLALVSDELWRYDAKFLADLGFSKLQTIVFFEKHLSREAVAALENPGFPDLRYTLLKPDEIDLLLKLDHASFPWLWWNNREEFEVYMQMPDVYVYMASDGDRPVGYASFTLYPGWAHLDRLAVVESEQGKRYGAAQLLFVLQRMVEAGKHDVGLSTQATNLQSHKLYTGFGFNLTSETMTFYGTKLDPAVVIE